MLVIYARTICTIAQTKHDYLVVLIKLVPSVKQHVPSLVTECETVVIH